jgi:hypothetical protein
MMVGTSSKIAPQLETIYGSMPPSTDINGLVSLFPSTNAVARRRSTLVIRKPNCRPSSPHLLLQWEGDTHVTRELSHCELPTP